MRILVAGANYAPETTSVAPYTTGLAEHLANGGHEVVVATTFPFYPQWRWYEPPPCWRTREQLNGVDVRRTRVILPPRQTALWRIVFDSSVALTTVLTALSISTVDVTICLSPPIQTTLVGAAIRFKLGKLVILVKDLPSEAARSVGILREGATLRLGRAVERLTYKLADHVVVISSAFAKHIQGLGVDPARISEIPDWADLESIRPVTADEEMRSRLGAGVDDFLLVHSGNMGAKQDLINAVDAAARLRSDPQFKLALVGDGMERSKIETHIAKLGLNNTKVLPLQPSHEFPRVLAAADALLVNQAPMVVDSVVPSKLLAYMASGRPIVAAVHGESTTAALVREAGCGMVTEPSRPEALAQCIRLMAAHQHQNRARSEMGRRGRAFAEEHFERHSVLSRWDALLAHLV